MAELYRFELKKCLQQKVLWITGGILLLCLCLWGAAACLQTTDSGLRGEEIPIAAQAAGLADVFDALVSRRVYKEPYPMDKAMEMIAAGECGAFDPLLVECLRELQDTLRREVYTGEENQ